MTFSSPNPRDAEPVDGSLAVSPRIEVDHEARRISLLLQLDATDINVSGNLAKLSPIGLKPKKEFHVTALDIKQGSVNGDIFDTLSDESQAAVISLLYEAKSDSWHVRPIDEFYLVEKHYEKEEEQRRSVIQLVDFPGLDDLYTKLNLLVSVGAKFEVPPAHITLAIQGSARGIGISSPQELRSLGTSLASPEQM